MADSSPYLRCPPGDSVGILVVATGGCAEAAWPAPPAGAAGVPAPPGDSVGILVVATGWFVGATRLGPLAGVAATLARATPAAAAASSEFLKKCLRPSSPWSVSLGVSADMIFTFIEYSAKSKPLKRASVARVIKSNRKVTENTFYMKWCVGVRLWVACRSLDFCMDR